MLNKAQKINISETNIAGLGTELEKEVRLNAAKTEKAWADVGKAVGLRVWRIEQFHIVEIPAEAHGTFYQGDSYIVLNTYKVPDQPKLYHDVHFWLGLETTQDEAGTAAYKTVELDDYLLGDPIQHREVQGSESKLFISYFKYFVVAQGGVASGFNKVEQKDYVPRLFQVSGNKSKTLVVRQVPKSCASLNDGDVFILDAGSVIYQWNAAKSSGQEKNKAMEFCRALAGERKGAKVVVYEYEDADAGPFWDGIGGKGSIAPANEANSPTKSSRVLFRISDSTGPLVCDSIAKDGDINASLLKSEDVFLLDTGSDIYIWVGKGASKEEKKNSLSIAMKYLVENNRNPATHISRVVEGGANQEFLSYFK